MTDIEKIADELYKNCLSATGAYQALKNMGADKHLPGFKHCVDDLKKAIKEYDKYKRSH